MAERDEPGRPSDDLFEDLDKFFSSIDEEDWPEPIGSGRGPRQGSPGEEEEPPATPPAEAEAPTPPEPEPSVSQPEPEPVVAEGDRDDTAGEEDEPLGAITTAFGEASLEEEAQPPRAPGQMSSADWSRLRDVLRDEDEAEADEEERFAYPGAGSPSTEESLFGYAGAEADDEEEIGPMSGFWETGGRRDAGQEEEPAEPKAGGELTLDDLRKAPPQYRDLPGPDDEGEPAGGFEPPAAPQRTGTGSSSFASDAKGRDLGPDLEDEPSLADVEAAADRVAGEFSATETPSGGEFDRPGPTPEHWLPGEFSREPAGPEGEPPGGVEDDLLGDLAEPRGPRKVKVGEPESMLGPSWEDPTARTVGPEPRGPRITGRNIPLAVISAVVLGIAALIFVLISKWLFAILAGGVVLVAQFELYRTSMRSGYHPATALGLVLGGLTLAAAYFKGEPAMAFMLALGVVLTFLWYMAAPPKARAGTLASSAVTILGLVYVPFLAAYILLVLAQRLDGRSLMLSVIGLTFLYDVAAFFVGSFYGSRPLARTISPKKSWEGLVAATFVVIIISMAFVSQIGPMNLGKAIGLALVVAVFAPLGDLAESAIKRDLGVKDMGTFMPGHGGMLDRIDSVLFVAPAAFYFFRLIF